MALTTAANTDSPSRWRTWLWAGLVLLIVGLLLAALSMARLLATVTEGDPPAVLDTPVTVVDYYTPDTYVVYQSQGSSSSRLEPGQVEVRGAVGSVPVTPSRFQETIEDGSGTWVSVAQFTITEAGEYSVAISAPDSQVRVATSLTSKVGGSLAWGAGIGLGGLISLTGLALAVVGVVRRPRAVSDVGVSLTAASQAVSAPAGWYADPTAPGVQRYWDGSAWTEHTA